MEQYDQLDGYCRMLGHYIPFRYCRTHQNGLPCKKILDCYFERIPIQDFIETHYTDEEKKTIFQESSPKMHSIIELIEQAKRRGQQQTNS